MNKLLIFAYGLILTLGGVYLGLHYSEQQPQPVQQPANGASFGGFTPVEGIPYTVGKTVLPSDTTITLSSFNTPDGRALTMANFGYKGYGTLDPNKLSVIESVSFTGISPQSNGTVQLTGVQRGLDFVSPYGASTTLAQTHLVGSSFILSNTAGFYGNEFLFANNTSTSSAVLIFSSTTPPRLDQPAAQANGTYIATTSEFATIAYVMNTVLSGAANATNAVKGIVQLATALQAASSTNLGSTGASDVLQSKYATDTPQNCSTPANGGCSIMSDLTGHLKQSWLNLTQLFAFSGGIISSASSTLVATTTIQANSTSTDALILNTVPYSFPSTQGASSTVWANDGHGDLVSEYVPLDLVSTTSAAFSTSATPGTIVQGKAYCVSPKIAISGGASTTGQNPNTTQTNNTWTGQILVASFPSASNAWTVSYYCGGNTSYTCATPTFTVTANCVNP